MMSLGRYLYSAALILISSSPFLGFFTFFCFSCSAYAASSSCCFCSRYYVASSARGLPRFWKKSKRLSRRIDPRCYSCDRKLMAVVLPQPRGPNKIILSRFSSFSAGGKLTSRLSETSSASYVSSCCLISFAAFFYFSISSLITVGTGTSGTSFISIGLTSRSFASLSNSTQSSSCFYISAIFSSCSFILAFTASICCLRSSYYRILDQNSPPGFLRGRKSGSPVNPG